MYNCIRNTVLVFNVFFLLCGMGILGIGIWVRLDMVQFDALLGTSMLPIAAYVLIAAGAVVLLISLAGCFGALMENRSLLGLYFSFMLLIFLMEAAAAVLGALFYDQVKPLLTTHVESAIINKYGDPNFKIVTQAVDVLQQQFGCCGFDNPRDWENSTFATSSAWENSTAPAVPISCCRDQNQPNCNREFNSTLNFDQGCIDSMASWMSEHLVYVLAVAIVVALTQLLGMIFAICLCKQVGEDDFV